MSLQNLVQVMPPPTTPVETGSADEWPSIEDTIGTLLPTDYKEYINTYGTGSIREFLWPYNPFTKYGGVNLTQRIELDLSALRYIREELGGDVVPYPLYPEPDGLLSWAISDNGDVLYWLTQGNPDAWPVVINESRGLGYERFEESATDFLAKLISGDLVSDILSSLQEGGSFHPIECG